MLRATNTGATAVVDARGRVQAQLAPFTFGVLSAQVQGMRGWTPYILFGNTLVLTAALLVLGSVWYGARRRAREPVMPAA
jgi:apolipoprotein N-acyltransferase